MEGGSPDICLAYIEKMIEEGATYREIMDKIKTLTTMAREAVRRKAAAMAEKGYTTREIAARLGIPVATLYKLLGGWRRRWRIRVAVEAVERMLDEKGAVFDDEVEFDRMLFKRAIERIRARRGDVEILVIRRISSTSGRVFDRKLLFRAVIYRKGAEGYVAARIISHIEPGLLDRHGAAVSNMLRSTLLYSGASEKLVGEVISMALKLSKTRREGGSK